SGGSAGYRLAARSVRAAGSVEGGTAEAGEAGEGEAIAEVDEAREGEAGREEGREENGCASSEASRTFDACQRCRRWCAARTWRPVARLKRTPWMNGFGKVTPVRSIPAN